MERKLAHAAIIDDKAGQILYFIKDCIRDGSNFLGSNMVVTGVNLTGLSVKWTDDETFPNMDAKGEVTGYDKTAAELAESPIPGPEIRRPDHLTWADAVAKRAELADLTVAQLDTYIDANVTDLASAKTYLKKLSKVVLGIIKMMDYKGGAS